MKIRHEFKNKFIESDSNEYGFMLTNRNSSYLSYSNDPSRYDGFFISEKEEMYKILDQIVINKPISKIINKFSHIEIEYQHLLQKIYMLNNLNSVVCLFDKHVISELFFDVKKSYDNRNFGRNYSISHENNKIIIKFDKFTDSKDNEPNGVYEYSIYVVINQCTFTKPNSWVNKNYSLDRSRNSNPYERYIYHGLKVITNKLVISASLDKNKAVNENNYIVKNLESLIKKQESYVSKLVSKFNCKDKELDFAYKCSINSLDQLTTERGILAGLPWFFQYWPRDELISSKGLSYFNKHKASQLINKNIDFFIKHGFMYSNQHSSLIAKDAIGLLILRASEIKNYDHKLIQYLSNIKKDYSMIHNNTLETWMDTNIANDNREGYRIEIQALYLRLYSIMYQLTKSKKFYSMEKNLKEEVIKKFYYNNNLKDGSDDSTTRPNIFLAYYFYNKLLSKDQWSNVFQTSIPKLWNNWGGFSSIEKSSPLFQAEYSGENNSSYHRGDSWFFLNNIAAICLHNLDRNRYSKYINSIVESSKKDILWNGYIGFSSELSSASYQKAQGCKAQSWSSATFIELIKEIKK